MQWLGFRSVSVTCVEWFLTSKSHCLYHLSRSPYGYGRPLVPLSDLSLGGVESL
jgi:hypothetical protein